MLTKVSKSVSDPGLHLMNFDNAIINGDFSIWQRGESFVSSDTTYYYFADMWFLNHSTDIGDTSVIDTTKEEEDGSNGIFSYARLTVNTAVTSLVSSSWFTVNYPIEGYNIRKFANKSICISFWVRSSITGKFTLAIRNPSFTYSCVATIEINSADTWEFKEIVFPPLSVPGLSNFYFDNQRGFLISIDFVPGGDNDTTTFNIWTNTNTYSAADQTNFLAISGTTIDLANFKMNPGVVATPFEYLPTAITEMLCKRYCQRFGTSDQAYNNFGSGHWYDTVTAWIIIKYFQEMRAVPTVSFSSQTGFFVYNGGGGWTRTTGIGGEMVGKQSLRLQTVVDSGGTTGNVAMLSTANATAYILLSAEL